MSGEGYAYRFRYADGSAFQITEDGRALIVYPDGRQEPKSGIVDNRIPLMIGRAAKPRQDEIDRLRAALEEIVQNGGQDLCRGIAAEALRVGGTSSGRTQYCVDCDNEVIGPCTNTNCRMHRLTAPRASDERRG